MSYWKICIPEILSDHGVDLDEDTLNSIIADIESAASVETDYTYTPNSEDEIVKLNKIIKTLESRTPCSHCKGSCGYYIPVGVSHKSWDECYHCSGKGWV